MCQALIASVGIFCLSGYSIAMLTSCSTKSPRSELEAKGLLVHGFAVVRPQLGVNRVCDEFEQQVEAA